MTSSLNKKVEQLEGNKAVLKRLIRLFETYTDSGQLSKGHNQKAAGWWAVWQKERKF